MNNGSHVNDLNCCLCCLLEWSGLLVHGYTKGCLIWSQLLVNFDLIEQEAPVGSRIGRILAYPRPNGIEEKGRVV